MTRRGYIPFKFEMRNSQESQAQLLSVSRNANFVRVTNKISLLIFMRTMKLMRCIRTFGFGYALTFSKKLSKNNFLGKIIIICFHFGAQCALLFDKERLHFHFSNKYTIADCIVDANFLKKKNCGELRCGASFFSFIFERSRWFKM